jgi:hypothetical protein
MMKLVNFSLEQGNKYYGRIDGQRFFIGTRTSYKGNKGLYNLTGTPAQKYNRKDFKDAYGFWADFIHPTACAEGALYHTLNTYDRARFTFSFLQFGAHVPDGDFVLYMRALLKLPLAKEYFPDLRLNNNRIARVTDKGVVDLESSESTDLLLDYLNPTSGEVEDTEVIQAAKFIHWAQNDAAHRQVQIDIGIANFKNKMPHYAVQYELDGVSDDICLVIADIRHQGRAKSSAIIAALHSPKPLDSLLKLGEPDYHSRIVTLRSEINKLKQSGELGVRKYSLAKKDFV